MKIKKSQNVPGPGTYESKIDPKNETSPKFGMGTSKRPALMINNAPGPGN